MKLLLQRVYDTGSETLGKLWLNDNFLCYILEDTYRRKKIMHKTRILAGTYKLKLRNYGGFYKRYIKKFIDIEHTGMIQVMKLLRFTDILIHIGNSKDDTSGCLLVGMDYRQGDKRIYLVNSTKAYKKIYPIIRNIITSGYGSLQILDEKKLSGSEIDRLIKGIE